MGLCIGIPLDYTIWFYIASVSLQLAGALLLLLFVISTKRSKVIRRFLSNGFISNSGNTNELSYREDVFKNHFIEAYLGKCSFLYLGMGYLFGVFGSNDTINRFLILILILMGAFLFILIAIGIVKLIVSYRKDIDQKITNDELIELGIEPDISTMSNADLDSIFEEVFGSDGTKE